MPVSFESMNRLLVLAEDADKFTSLVKSRGLPQLEIVAARGLEDARTLIPGCNIVLGEPILIGQSLDSVKRLEWVQSSWAGVDSLCRPGLRQDYILTGVKGVFGALISEYVMTYLFAIERKIFEVRDNQRQKHWQPKSYRLAKDITLGIVGLGSIGKHLARTAVGFGLHVTGLNRSGRACENVEKVYTEEGIAEFLAAVDYLVLTLPDTAETRHFMNAETLAMMKPSAVLINVGRGGIINEEDLIIALQQERIGSAVLDVFETEPLPAESPLWALPNVYVTPHFAAPSFPEDVVEIFVENYARFVQGRPLLHIINFERGY